MLSKFCICTQQNACITVTEDFPLVCLHKTILEKSLGISHHTHDERREHKNTNYRFAAYRQYIGWIYGRPGRNERRPIPSSILTKIREIFPSTDNKYVPFTDISNNIFGLISVNTSNKRQILEFYIFYAKNS